MICTYISANQVYHAVTIKSTDFVLKQVQKELTVLNKVIETTIGNHIRTIREKKGMTQDVLSAKLQLRGCDITRSALAKMEVGQRHIYPDELLLIKEILETDFDSIFYGE